MRIRLHYICDDLCELPDGSFTDGPRHGEHVVWESQADKDVDDVEWVISTIEVRYTDGSTDEIFPGGAIIQVELI